MIGQIEINSYDCLVIRRLYNVDKRPEWFYKSKIKGHCPQYSDAYVEWLIKKVQQNKDFFKETRKKYKKQKDKQ